MPVNKNTNEWGQLSMKDRADLIAIYTKSGYTSIDDIRKDYEQNRSHFINSDANFVQRLRNEDNRSIKLNNGDDATHLMNYVEGDNQSTVYPSIQESEGRLVNHENDRLGGYYSAADNRDTVNVSKPFAEYYTPRYKRDFQGFFEKFVPQKKTVEDMNDEFIYDNRREDSNVLAPGGDLDDNNKYLDGTQEWFGTDVNWYDLQDKYPSIYKKFRPKKPRFLSIKDMAYNVSANSQGDAYVDSWNIMDYALNNSQYIPTIYAYIYGPDKVYNRFNGKSNGFDYADYINKTGYKNVNEYNGLFNENNQYGINIKNKAIVEELARNKAHIYDSNFVSPSYMDDVGHYIHQFGFDKDGNVVISDSDIYDFYPGDRTFKNRLHKAEYELMQNIGNPYILRQDNIPIEFSNENTMIDYIINNFSDEDIARLTNSGFIEPAVVKANKFGGKVNRFDDGGDTQTSILRKAYNWIVGLFDNSETDKTKTTNIIEDIDNRTLEEFRQKNRQDKFERKKNNDSPTSTESESIEDDINSRERRMFNEAIKRRGDFKDYYIPYIEEKEIVIPKVGRVSTNILDSLAINAERAGIKIQDALGLASIETKFGATPNISTSAWKKRFVEKNKRGPTNEEVKKYERECLNASYARNFGGIYPNFLINDHDWYNYGWEQSGKHKDLIDIKSPLQHGFTIYKKGLYNTGDKKHSLKIREEGERLFKTKPIQLWYEQYKKDRKEGKINK